MIDFCKHLMTLSVAFIAAFGALLGTVFQEEASARLSKHPLISVTFFLLILVLLFSFVGMRLYENRIFEMRDVPIESAQSMQRFFDDLPHKLLLGIIGWAVFIIFSIAIVVFSFFVVGNA